MKDILEMAQFTRRLALSLASRNVYPFLKDIDIMFKKKQSMIIETLALR